EGRGEGVTGLSRDFNPSPHPSPYGRGSPPSPRRKRWSTRTVRQKGAGRMQVLVIGAGVVGLAVARAAALAGHDVVVAEAASGIGTGVSSRNSEVIHAGLYYPTGSLRAYHCPCGRRMLYDFCASHGVPHRRCGKLVVATNAGEVERLAPLHKQAQANGVEGVELIDAAAAKR